jgi:hypothetical protein
MKKLYLFKVALKHRKGLWRRIEIRSDQTLSDFDNIIRDAFNHDRWDHLSEFYKERWSQGGFGEIYPDGRGRGTKKRIERFGLSEDDKLGYVYDFGDEIHHVLNLEKITEPEKGVKYPRIISKNKPSYRYCEVCKEQGKKTIAKWICIECSEDVGNDVFLCEDCMDEHDDHYAEEILY